MSQLSNWDENPADSTSVPDVSILMPVHNGEQFIAEAVQSLRAQTLADWELLAVLDGCTDRTRDILESFSDSRINLLEPSGPVGMHAAMNIGLRASRADLIARFDADDVCLARRLEVQVSVMRAQPALGLLGSSALLIDGESNVIGSRPVRTGSRLVSRGLLWRNQFIHPAVMYRRSLALQLNGYDERFRVAADYHLWLRMVPCCWVNNLDQPLIGYREHPGQMSRQSVLTEPQWLLAEARGRAAAHLEISRTGRVLRNGAWLGGQLRREMRYRLGMHSRFLPGRHVV